MKNIFVPGVGQHENIGDIILRRPLINWLRESGELHIYVGASTIGYDRGLGIQPQDVLYHSFIKWYLSALWQAIKLNAHYAFKPGEVQLTIMGLKEHLVMLPLLAILRLTGGKVIRIGSGARNYAALPRMFMMPSVWLSNIVMWRDPVTTAYMGAGATMPDLAFVEGANQAEHLPLKERNILVVSMRGDREHPSDEWLEAVKLYAAQQSLSVVLITQVLRDSALSKKLADKLGAGLIDWDGENHDVQEKQLRDLYARTHTVVSDRLHVLITAYTHGALPIGMLSYASDKIKRHFDAAGVNNICIFTSGMNKNAIFDAMKTILENHSTTLSALSATREKLLAIKKQVSVLLA
ncbi:polysaccharide pyruvyl transferase family protein [Methylophilus sp.]|uniref:polysaccharide pyruvyl transferase family protein n=1 Tax=Methylophilus sp. TaxID=29541 RepID=UPI000D4B56A4|nr:polysaccharide pyruvyl transferase family protein [Methylophilus sp.]PPD12385.1 MAG: hypothetical protein CTY26_05025 [Methylophilus sp.]